jgi:hypothetical protein
MIETTQNSTKHKVSEAKLSVGILDPKTLNQVEGWDSFDAGSEGRHACFRLTIQTLSLHQILGIY